MPGRAGFARILNMAHGLWSAAITASSSVIMRLSIVSCEQDGCGVANAERFYATPADAPAPGR